MDNNMNNHPKRRHNSTPGHRINLICLLVVLVLFSAVAVINIARTDRPTISESENRTLAAFPEFSFSALIDGSFYDGLTDWFSDTFLCREQLISVAQNFKSAFGFDYTIDGEKYIFVDVGGNETKQDETTEDIGAYIDITLPPVTTKPVTTKPEETTSPEPPSTDIPFRVVSVSLSSDTLNIPVGTDKTLTAVYTTEGVGSAGNAVWTVENPEIISVESDGLCVTITALKGGSSAIYVSVDGVGAVCEVSAIIPEVQPEQEVRDFTDSYLFVYGDAIYTPVSYNDKTLINYSQSYSKCLKYVGDVLGGARVSVLPVPLNSAVLDTSKITKAGRNQGEMLQIMQANYDSGINFVNIYNTVWAHRTEYLYYKTDHHWTALGAYYGYENYMNSIGGTPTPLSSLEKKILSTDFLGSRKSFLTEHGLSNMKDELDVYMPNVSAKMKVTIAEAVYENGKLSGYNTYQRTYNETILTGRTNSYTAFISGDQPMQMIETSVNNGKTVLVLKDSFGCAITPYLTMNYERVIVIDPRHYYKSFTDTIQEQLKDYKIDDVLVTMDLENFCGTTFMNYIYKLVGVNVSN